MRNEDTAVRGALVQVLPERADDIALLAPWGPIVTWLVSILAFALALHRVDATPLFPDMGTASPLTLTDAATDRPLLPELRGKSVLVSFISATCRETCPMTEGTFAVVARDLGLKGDISRVQLVLVTVDPVHDTQPRLRALAHKLGIDRDTLHFATGSPQQVDRLLRAYGIAVHFRKGTRENPDHTVTSYLIDPSWHVRYDFGPGYPASAIARLTDRFIRSTTR